MDFPKNRQVGSNGTWGKWVAPASYPRPNGRGCMAGNLMLYILVTGAAGFIGFHTARALLDRGHEIWRQRRTTATP